MLAKQSIAANHSTLTLRVCLINPMDGHAHVTPVFVGPYNSCCAQPPLIFERMHFSFSFVSFANCVICQENDLREGMLIAGFTRANNSINFLFSTTRGGSIASTTNAANTGCPKINETHKIANKYVDFNPIVYIFQI